MSSFKNCQDCTFRSLKNIDPPSNSAPISRMKPRLSRCIHSIPFNLNENMTSSAIYKVLMQLAVKWVVVYSNLVWYDMISDMSEPSRWLLFKKLKVYSNWSWLLIYKSFLSVKIRMERSAVWKKIMKIRSNFHSSKFTSMSIAGVGLDFHGKHINCYCDRKVYKRWCFCNVPTTIWQKVNSQSNTMHHKIIILVKSKKQ